jgi:hypothetical protein
MNKINTQKGFGVVEAISIFAIIVVLGLGGFYIWKQQQPDADTKNIKPQKQEQTKQEPEPADETTNWQAYSNEAGNFSFKYPKTWVFADNLEACANGLVMFAPEQSSLGKCASESAGQMMVLGTDGDNQAGYKLGQGYLTDYIDLTNEDVKINGVTGIKQSAVASKQEGVGVLPDGTKIVQYIFYANNKTYVAKYTQRASYPDVLSDFEKLVTKTLRFSAQ